MMPAPAPPHQKALGSFFQRLETIEVSLFDPSLNWRPAQAESPPDGSALTGRASSPQQR